MSSVADEILPFLGIGKMLRARLTLALGAVTGMDEARCVETAVAVEMTHLASLLHDDVIDNGLLRRGNPALWVAKGAAGAVLMGDYLFCRAITSVVEFGDMPFLSTWVRLVRDVCDAELEQELVLNGSEPDWGRCLDLARRKTGSLFALAARGAAAHDPVLGAHLLEAGFELGTAYQLADDLLDVSGAGDGSDKTLGHDALQNKLTAGVFVGRSECDPRVAIERLIGSARQRLSDYPDIQACWADYVAEHFRPVVERFTLPSGTAAAVR